MRIFARIQDGRVAELFRCPTNILSMFHPTLVWVDVSSENSTIAEGWRYDGSVFSPPPLAQPVTSPTLIDDIHKQLIALAAQVEAIKQSGSPAPSTGG
jgi:hypothetical protein